jgi:hypothetical protein
MTLGSQQTTDAAFITVNRYPVVLARFRRNGESRRNLRESDVESILKDCPDCKFRCGFALVNIKEVDAVSQAIIAVI